MPWSLRRYYNTGALHFITFSCHQRAPLLGTPERRDLLLTVIEQMRLRYEFVVVGYVVMPEHVHFLISEPQIANPSTVVQAIKLGFHKRMSKSGCPISAAPLAAEVGLLQKSPIHFWTKRFYDFNVWSQFKQTEKLRYMHRNPVVRGLVERPEDWPWSSFRAYALGEQGAVRINDWSRWEEKIRKRIS